MDDKNKNFIKEDPGMGMGAMILLVLAAILVFGGLGWVLIHFGSSLALPKGG